MWMCRVRESGFRVPTKCLTWVTDWDSKWAQEMSGRAGGEEEVPDIAWSAPGQVCSRLSRRHGCRHKSEKCQRIAVPEPWEEHDHSGEWTEKKADLPHLEHQWSWCPGSSQTADFSRRESHWEDKFERLDDWSNLAAAAANDWWGGHGF